MAIGTPANTLAGAAVNSVTTQALSIPSTTAGVILLISSHARRAAALAPSNPTLADTSGSPLAWTPVFATPPSMVGASISTKAQWWWARSDGNAHNPVTLTWLNAGGNPAIQSSVASFTIGAGQNPGFTNQISGGNDGAGAVTVTYPTSPSSGINFISFYGAGGSTSTIATGYVSLTNIASNPYRVGYDLTPGTNAVMGANFPAQMLLAVNIVEVAQATSRLGKIWNGSAWVTKPVKVWSGSAWVTKPVKIWNGSAWV